MRDVVHFAHGNGFPSGCYQQLLNDLQTHYDCFTVDKIGHSEEYPVTDNWPCLVKEIINSVQATGNVPVIGIGHSLGGVLTLLAAIEQPSLFKAVIMIDSPMLNRFKSTVVGMAKKIYLIDRITPAHRTRGRRRHWSTREELLEYLSSRSLFQTFDKACLYDYIEYGFEHTDSGYTLRFDPKIEYSIFRTLPHQIPKHKGKLTMPVILIYGDKSTIVRPSDVRYMQKSFAIQAYSLPGTHMLPFEHPHDVAQQIFSALAAII